MADEITVTLSVVYDNNGVEFTRSLSDSITQTGDTFTWEIQSVGTSEEELAQGAELGTPGIMVVHNLDATNYVEIGSTTGVYDIKLLAGEFAIYRHNSATVYAKANTAACLVEYLLFEL